MSIKITEQTEEPLFGRKKVIAEFVTDQVTPSKEDVKNSIASQVKSDAGLVVIDIIKTEFGSRSGTIVSYVYDSKESFAKTEIKSRKEIRAEKEAEKKAREEAAAKKAEEAKAAEEAKKAEEAKAQESASEENKEDSSEEKKESPAEEKGSSDEKKENKE